MKSVLVILCFLASTTAYAVCPTISNKLPSSGATISGTYAFEANASDDKGISQVTMSVDGKLSPIVEHFAPFQFPTDTNAYPDGTHSVQYEVTDTGGCKVKSSAVSFQVRNSAPAPTSTALPSASPLASGSPTPVSSPTNQPTPLASPTPPSLNVFPASNPVPGYSTLKPSSDSKIIYVSVSGSDTNDGLSPSKAIQTPSLAFAKIRSGMPDWIVFKSGDVWSRKIAGIGSIQGRSATEPVVISRYGSGPRPEFAIANERGFYASGTVKNLTIEGLHIRGKAWSDSTVTDSTGIRIQIGSGENITIENVFIEKTNDGIVVSDGSAYKNVTVRRSVIVDLKPAGSGWAGRKEGIYASKITGLNLIENVFDMCGWNPADPKTRTVFSHCAYIADTVYGLLARGNIFSRGSEDGLKMRRGGVAEDNFFIQNAIGISVNDYKLTGISTTLKNNVFTDHSLQALYDYGSTPQTRNYGTWAPKVTGSTIADSGNVFFNSGTGPQGSKAFADYGSTTANKIYKWGRSTNTAGPFPDPTRTIQKYHKEILGGSGNLNDFFNEMRAQSRESYKPEYSATEINKYLRAGF